ncbi:hypothetical protein CDAR_105431 [Caerostris darwini]|uniref:Uncharacterized protein n=1 Tax=Caerostris darwini TaxID=1538125 RepID=A0AAV4MXH8_9ARAC|nr:hypothetical protein CDAR_105431 [Caerostris darwini]
MYDSPIKKGEEKTLHKTAWRTRAAADVVSSLEMPTEGSFRSIPLCFCQRKKCHQQYLLSADTLQRLLAVINFAHSKFSRECRIPWSPNPDIWNPRYVSRERPFPLKGFKETPSLPKIGYRNYRVGETRNGIYYIIWMVSGRWVGVGGGDFFCRL